MPDVRLCWAFKQESDKIRLRREAKKNNGFYVEDEAKLVFVVRIRGINDMHPKVRSLPGKLVQGDEEAERSP